MINYLWQLTYTTRQIFEFIENGQMNLRTLPARFHSNRELVMACLMKYGHELRILPPEYEGDADLYLAALKSDPEAYRFIPEQYITLEMEKLAASSWKNCEFNPNLIKHVSDSLGCIVTLLKQNVHFYTKLSDELKDKGEITIPILMADPTYLEMAPKRFQDDEELVIKLIAKKNEMFVTRCIPRQMKGLPSVSSAILQAGYSLSYIPTKFHSDFDFLDPFIRNDAKKIFSWIPKGKANQYIDLISHILWKNGEAIEFIRPAERSIIFVTLALESGSAVWEHVPKNLLSNRKFMLSMLPRIPYVGLIDIISLYPSDDTKIYFAVTAIYPKINHASTHPLFNTSFHHI